MDEDWRSDARASADERPNLSQIARPSPIGRSTTSSRTATTTPPHQRSEASPPNASAQQQPAPRGAEERWRPSRPGAIARPQHAHCHPGRQRAGALPPWPKDAEWPGPRARIRSSTNQLQPCTCRPTPRMPLIARPRASPGPALCLLARRGGIYVCNMHVHEYRCATLPANIKNRTTKKSMTAKSRASSDSCSTLFSPIAPAHSQATNENPIVRKIGVSLALSSSFFRATKSFARCR